MTTWANNPNGVNCDYGRPSDEADKRFAADYALYRRMPRALDSRWGKKS